jgi:hypothetical protein
LASAHVAIDYSQLLTICYWMQPSRLANYTRHLMQTEQRCHPGRCFLRTPRIRTLGTKFESILALDWALLAAKRHDHLKVDSTCEVCTYGCGQEKPRRPSETSFRRRAPGHWYCSPGRRLKYRLEAGMCKDMPTITSATGSPCLDFSQLQQ